MSLQNKILFFLACLLFWAGATVAQEIIRHPARTEALQSRWQWSRANAPKSGNYWVGFSIEKRMSENSFIGHFNSKHPPTEVVLRELIYGEKVEPRTRQTRSDDEVIRDLAKSHLDGRGKSAKSMKKVLKEVAVLFFYEGATGEFSKISWSNVSLAFDLEGVPLVWLGKANDRESVGLLTALYKRTQDLENKARLVSAVGLHDDADLAVPHLSRYVFEGETRKIRKNAVYRLSGYREHKDVPAILEKVAFEDADAAVQKNAVYRIAQISNDESVKSLEKIAKKHENIRIRKEAIYRLGKMKNKAAREALIQLISRKE